MWRLLFMHTFIRDEYGDVPSAYSAVVKQKVLTFSGLLFPSFGGGVKMADFSRFWAKRRGFAGFFRLGVCEGALADGFK
jgi:hypothetical protein